MNKGGTTSIRPEEDECLLVCVFSGDELICALSNGYKFVFLCCQKNRYVYYLSSAKQSGWNL